MLTFLQVDVASLRVDVSGGRSTKEPSDDRSQT